MNNAKLVKILGLVATAVGMGATLITDWVNEKKMEEKIDERINEKLAALSEEEDEESCQGLFLFIRTICVMQARLFRLFNDMLMSICSVHPSHGQSMNSEKGHISNGLHMKSVIESWTSLSMIQSPSSKTSCSRWLCMLVTARMSNVALYFRMRLKQPKN